MLLVILGIVILITVGSFIWGTYDDWRSGAPFALAVFGVVGTIIIGVIMLCCGYSVSEAKVIDEKITMYQSANEKIEKQIAEAVQQYQEYEQGTFEKVAPESAVTMVTLYPELKSDELVKKQISVYVSNNKKITELKEKKINAAVDRWWLYFGG